METVLWAINMVAVVYCCFWALKQDGGRKKKDRPTDQQRKVK